MKLQENQTKGINLPCGRPPKTWREVVDGWCDQWMPWKLIDALYL